MITRLRITDVTRMGAPRVCVAGYDDEGRCVRPVLRYASISEAELETSSGLIAPFAEVEYDLTPAPSTPPHVEDHVYAGESVRWVRWLSEGERLALLRATARPHVEDAFGAPLVHISSHFVRMGSGDCSLITVPVRGAPAVQAREADGKLKWRLLFRDSASRDYSLPITDLTWHYFAALQQHFDKGNPSSLAQRLTRLLNKELIFLRLGLTREHPAGSHQCWVQVNGIYTFPDYLDGHSFVEYRNGLEATPANQ